ncbi:MAG: class I SAM-dependent methyltransferase [Dehalococcoidia bacterium]
MSEERLGFDNVPEIYDRARPSYPAALFEDLLTYLDAPPGQVVRAVEIGPGTGKATASLLERSVEVTAVEIGVNLAAFLRKKLPDERLTVINAAYEDIALEPASYDLVVSATAFHWVDPAVRLRKSHEALRAAGAIAIIETNQIASDADRGFFKPMHQIILKHSPGEKWDDPPSDDVTPAIYDELLASELFAGVELRRYRWDQTYSTAQYADLTRSFGGTQAMEHDAAESMVAEICDLVDREFGGSVTRPLVMTLTLGRKRSDDSSA